VWWRGRSLENLVNYIIKIRHLEELKEVVDVLDLVLKVRRQQLYTINNSHYNK
jgi:hypothetical protein